MGNYYIYSSGALDLAPLRYPAGTRAAALDLGGILHQGGGWLALWICGGAAQSRRLWRAYTLAVGLASSWHQGGRSGGVVVFSWGGCLVVGIATYGYGQLSIATYGCGKDIIATYGCGQTSQRYKNKP